MKKLMTLTFALLSFVPQMSLAQSSYCAAIRGNGEGMPAHWGAMSAVIQEKGFPTAMAGGSSASLTIFLLESLSLSAQDKSNTEKALLVKSFQGYFEALSQSDEGKAIQALLADKAAFAALISLAQDLENLSNNLAKPEVMSLLGKHLGSLQVLAESDDFKRLLNPEFIQYVQSTTVMLQALEQGDANVTEGQVAYRKDQITKAIQNFGKFDAQTDETLFFRPGLVSFVQLAKVIGQMADFYAGIPLSHKESQQQVDADMSQFLSLCAPGSEKLSWRELHEQRPFCRQLLGRAVLTYRKAAKLTGAKDVRIHEKIGTHLATFPTTSVLTGSSVADFKKMRGQYLTNEDPTFGTAFTMPQDELRFGYWGSEKALKSIQSKLKTLSASRQDEKSKKFLSLGDASWLQALSASPAEPGLSSLVDLSETMISAGGWNDLHPTHVLRAYGCKDIVYVTRRGGESMFAQGVIKKLTNLEGFSFEEWIGLTADERVEKNKKGDPTDLGPEATLWSKLYNMANPKSSLRSSMKAATTIVCSDWDRYDARKDLNALVEDSFRAPWITDKKELCH